MKKWIFFAVLLTWFTHEILVAQDCEVTVEHNAGNAIIADIESNIESYTSGGWVSYSQEHITKIENTGRNDLLVRTRHSNGNIDEYHTINNGNQTLWFPLPNFAGTSLHQVRCLTYATIHDTEHLISEFGGSAQNLINDAQSAAEQGALDAKESLLELVNVANYQTFQQQAEQSQQQMEEQWEELQQLAAESAEIGEVVISQHFPELHEAIQATTSLNVNIPEAVLQTLEQNLESIKIKFQEMDQKYEVSSNINAFANIDLQNHFPELYAVEEYQCSLNTDLFDQFENEFNRFLTAFGELMKTDLIPESKLPVLQFTANELEQLQALFNPPPCFRELEKSHEIIQKDLENFRDFVSSIRANLGLWELRWFPRGNESVYEDSQKLLAASDRLLRLLDSQIRHEYEASEARGLLIDSYQVVMKSSQRQLQVIRPEDSDQIEDDFDSHEEYLERYQRAVVNRDRGWVNIRGQEATWARDAADLASSVSRLRLRVTVISDFNGLMSRPVELDFPAQSIRLAQDCMKSTYESTNTALTIFRNSISRYLADIQSLINSMIPDELYLALELHYEAIAELNALVNANANLALKNGELGNSYLLLTEAYADLALGLTQNPADPDYLKNLDDLITALSQRSQQVTSDYNEFNQAWETARPDYTLLANALTEFKTSLESNLTLRPEFRELFNTSLTIENILTGVDSRVQSVNECISGKLEFLKNAFDTFPQRSNAFMNTIAEKGLDTVPDEVKNSITRLLDLTEIQISNYADLRSWEVVQEEIANGQSFVMTTAFAPLDFVQFHNEFLLALLPIPQPDAMPKLEILVQSFDDLVIETQELRAEIESIIETDQMAAQEFQTLAMYARTQNEEMSIDLAELQMIAFDGSSILAEIEKMEDISALWTVALIETAARITGLNDISQQIETVRSAIEQALQNLASQTSTAFYCATGALQVRSAISNQPLAEAVDEATSDIVSQANSVFNDLQDLLNPTSGIINSVQQVITTGQNLLEEVQQSYDKGEDAFEIFLSNFMALNIEAGNEGQDSYETLASGNLYQQFQDAISCVDSTSGMIQQRMNELIGYYNEILEESHSTQMQIIQSSFNFDPNN